jgi:large subunit ribosomal protein L31
MKTGVHPTYYPDAQVVCACGNIFTTGSTKPQIKVEICAKCHPFYTGAQKFVDTVGKIEKFQAKQKTAAAKQAVVKQKKQAKQETDNHPKTLREMLLAVKGT